jgi:hypothetical protein
VKELKEKNIDIENSTQVMSDLFEDVKHNCSSNKTEIDTLKRRFEEVVERTSIRREVISNELTFLVMFTRLDLTSSILFTCVSICFNLPSTLFIKANICATITIFGNSNFTNICVLNLNSNSPPIPNPTTDPFYVYYSLIAQRGVK